MSLFFQGILKSVHFYIYLVLFTMLGTLYFVHWRDTVKLEKRATQLQKCQDKNKDLTNSIQEQNNEITRLKEKGQVLKNRVANSNNVIEILDKNGKSILLALDEQDFPNDCQAALDWLVEKANQELGE